MSKIHEERAKWLYAANAKALTAEDCARQAVAEFGEPPIPRDTAQIFDITQHEYTEAYIKELATKIKETLNED